MPDASNSKSSQVESDTYPDSQLCILPVCVSEKSIQCGGQVSSAHYIYQSRWWVGLPRGNSAAISNTQRTQKFSMDHAPDRESNFGKDKATRKTQTTKTPK